MRFLVPLVLITSTFSLSSEAAVQPHCQQAIVPVKVTAHPQVISLDAPKDQEELTGLVVSMISQQSNVSQSVHGPTTLTTTYNIWTLLCLPSNSKPNVLEFAVHGINFDHSYWNFGGEGSPYNYVDAAVRNGHAIFLYDRLGVGQSSKPDGIKEVQQDTEIEVAAELIRYIRKGGTKNVFRTIIGIGHSFGSLQLAGIATRYPDLLNATVLTGFTPYTGGLNTASAAFGLTIAAQVDRTRFGALSNSYLATGTISNDQAPFLLYPFFDSGVLRLASQTKQTATIGEFLTLGASPATNYTNPVLVVAGDKDFIFCGGDCYQSFAGFDNLVEAAQILFPSTSRFNFSIPANTGHAINLHHAAKDVYKTIQSWISELN
ncbi:hypothetical protein CVT26_007881 [Gymnopilus dilepis]|uniref:AB hydrolase-1 domain-containing protein n=1 Tax=Gymnopilus dilepis TaxID=231916 RepID=A0A409YKC9_9AGAR|nr:hypothetical protein CVT26_007881 [Gymnopilus dilepis]